MAIEGLSGSGFDDQFWQTDAVNPGILWESPHPLSIVGVKRVDILIVDQGGWPVVAIEHQGVGHYQGTAAARDAVKKEALRKAGVRYVEVSETDSDEQIRSRVRENLGWRNQRANVGN